MIVTQNAELGIYHTALLIMECVAAKRLHKLQHDRTNLTEEQYEIISKVASQLPYTLTERQMEAVEKALSHSLYCKKRVFRP